MPGMASVPWKRLAIAPAAGQRQVRPLTARDGAGGTATGATGGAVVGAGIPATGTIPADAAATGGALEDVGGVDAGTPGLAVDATTGGVAWGAGGATDSNTGAAATDPEEIAGVAAVAGATGRPGAADTEWLSGDKRRRCPGQMVYGSATWFHWARSRKSTPLRNAIEYSVSPLSTV